MKFAVEHFQVFVVLGILAASILSGFLARGPLRRLKTLASRTGRRGDDALVESLRRPLPLWFGLSARARARRCQDGADRGRRSHRAARRGLRARGAGAAEHARDLPDALSNLFAGVHIMLAGYLRIGDFVKRAQDDALNVEREGARGLLERLPRAVGS